jgi:hypothetical protein
MPCHEPIPRPRLTKRIDQGSIPFRFARRYNSGDPARRCNGPAAMSDTKRIDQNPFFGAKESITPDR